MRRPILLALLIPLGTQAADIQSLTVTRDATRYHVDLQVTLQAPAAAAYQAFANPANLPRINPNVQQVQVLERSNEQSARLYTEVRVCAMLYCKTLRQIQDMHYEARPDGGEMQAEVRPEASDFHYGHADWSFRPAGPNTQLHFTAELEPAFWIPPVIGPWLVERSLREEAERTSAGIEKLAKPRD